jgi:cytochrome b6
MNSLLAWLGQRFQIEDLINFAKKKDVPVHHGFVWYYFGGISLFLFIVQVFTGALLLLYYKPGADTAFESVQFIITKVKYGWLIRSMHSWSANLMVLTVFIHMFSNFFESTYRKPRELTWITGVFLFFLVLGFGFSGYLLPWNELAFFATKVGTDIAGVLPIVGKPLLVFLRGGEEVTGGTLSRFFGFHVAILPGVFFIFLMAHLAFIQFQGMSEPLRLEGKIKRRMPFFPDFAMRDVILWFVVFNVIAFLAVFFPWELGAKADPFTSAPAGIKPEWYFMFMFQTLKFLPAKILFFEGEVLGIAAFSLAGAALLFWPFIERKSSRGEKQPIVYILGIAAIIFIVVMTAIGYTRG